MDILNLIPVVYERFMVFILVMTRISGLFSTFIVFKREHITGRVIVGLSTILSLYVIILYQQAKFDYDVFSLPMLMQTIFQFLIGFMTGLILNIVFEVFLAFGQILSTQIGLSIASLIDPRFGNITTLSHFYIITATIIFFSLNGHLFIIKLIVDSFSILPLNQNFIPKIFISNILSYSSIIFSGSILAALTIIMTILLVNITIAVMTKFAPQINLFTIGINISLVIGLICLYLTFRLFTDASTAMINDCLVFLQQSFGKLR